jgi:hypothetical protein
MRTWYAAVPFEPPVEVKAALQWMLGVSRCRSELQHVQIMVHSDMWRREHAPCALLAEWLLAVAMAAALTCSARPPVQHSCSI